MSDLLDAVMRRAASWPKEAQAELAAVADELEASLRGEVYHPTAEEQAGIARGLRAIQKGDIASAGDIDAAIARHRPG